MVAGLTFRHSVFREYKSHRLVTPDTVRHAVRDTKHALLGMGVKVIEVSFSLGICSRVFWLDLHLPSTLVILWSIIKRRKL
jgi:hypothetical protein